MRKNKKFDCVRMKWDIQQKITEEFSGVPDKETHKVQMGRVMQNPILGPFYKKVQALKETSTK